MKRGSEKLTQATAAFYERHPFVTAFCAALLCLCVKQTYQAETGLYVAQSGIYLVKGALTLAAVLLLIFSFFDDIKKDRSLKQHIGDYAIVLGVVVFTYFTFQHISGADYILTLGLIYVNIDTVYKTKQLNGAILCAAVLLVFATFGFNVFTVGVAAIIAAVFAWFCGSGVQPDKRAVATVLPLLVTAAVYFFYDGTTQALFACGALAVIGVGAVLSLYGRLDNKQLIFLMLAVGFVARVSYVLTIAGSQNQHDVWSINNASPKHNTYIKYIYENAALPQTYENLRDGLSQYYHPPLHHVLAALWIRLQTAFGLDFYVAYENVQYLTVFYSTAVMLVSRRLFEAFDLKAGGLLVASAVVAFHPAFYMLAGSVNNDILCLLFTVIAMLYCVRFYREQSIRNTVLLALAIGLAMMTKLNGAMVAIGVGGVFLYMLFGRELGGFKASFTRLWQRFVLFGAICCPLGLWWPIYTKLKFGLPIGHVPSMSKNSTQYIGDHSFLERIFGLDYFRIENIYPNIGRTDIDGLHVGEKFYEHGILPYSFKSSLFGEYFWRSSSREVAPAGVPQGIQVVIAYLLVIAALLLAVLAVYAMVKYLIGSIRRTSGKKCIGEHSVPMQFLLLVYMALFGSFVVFCFKYPFTCTMDFRYIAALLPVTAVLLGKLSEPNELLAPAKTMQRSLYAVTAVFSLASLAFYYMYF